MKIDSLFKQTTIAWHHWRVAGRRWLAALRDDLGARLAPRVSRRAGTSTSNRAPVEKPSVFVSYATADGLSGSHKFCGGEKLLNNLVILLRRHGYDAWMVSRDGNHADWLAEHAPFLSLEEFQTRLASSSAVRCVTSWIVADAFLRHCPRFYFWDQELAASSRGHFPEVARMMARGRIIRTAGVNRSVQAWHRATFGTPAMVLRQLVDERHWRPDEVRRIPGRIGYFDEGEHGERFLAAVRRQLQTEGLEPEFHMLRGDEKEIIAQMQTCGVFIALNVGKSPLWGEGGPMTPQEAMACGTVPVCFDINGPWELIQQDYNGVITGEITPEALAEAVAGIYRTPGRLAEMSRRCLEITATSHTMEARWPDVRRFLDLPE
jgi:hypothetical protein